jgi:HAD superfamily hydrolase (TIGR01493 family)
VIEAVLFDFAGTLFAPRDAAERVRGAARDLGLAPDEEEVARLAAAFLRAGLPGGPYPARVPAALEAAYARRDLEAAAHREAYVGLLSPVAGAAFAEALYEEVTQPAHWVPYADTHAVVGRLVEAGLAVGVVSNVAFDLRPVLRAHGLPALAEHCTLSCEHGAAKPEPALFAAALRDVGAAAERTLMVGDHPLADGGAAAAGLQTLILPMSPPGARHGLDAVLERVL